MKYASPEQRAAIANAIGLLPDEPYFIVRGQDVFAPAVIEAYANLIEAAAAVADGSVIDPAVTTKDQLLAHAESVNEAVNEVRYWQVRHPTAVKVPD